MADTLAAPAEGIRWDDLGSSVSIFLQAHKWESNGERAFVWALVDKIEELAALAGKEAGNAE